MTAPATTPHRTRKPTTRLAGAALIAAATIALVAACGGGGYGGGTSSSSMGTATAPSITAQPQSATVATGATATFMVAATGFGPLSYQWLDNGNAIGGATAASYTTPPVTAADNNAMFAVRVTNAYGTVTSSPAMLTVM